MSKGGKIGLIVLKDGPGMYHFDQTLVNFWDVEVKSKKDRTVFGIEFGSYIIYDIQHIPSLFIHFDEMKMDKQGEVKYFKKVSEKILKNEHAIIQNISQVGLGDGWHEVSWKAFSKQKGGK